MANKELKSITFEGLDNTYTLLTEGEVNTKLSEYAKTSEITQIDIQTVSALPKVGVKGVIYLVPSSTLKMTPLLGNRLAVVQANTNNSATFTVDKTTNIKAGMTLKFVNNGIMGEATVASVTASTKTVTLTTKATLAKGTLVFDNSKYGKDTCAEYIWNPSTNKFERLGTVDVNAVSTAIPQSVVARDWNGRAQIENPSVAKDIANKDYVDNTVNNKLSEYAKKSELDEKLDKGNFSITENNITSPVDGTITSQRKIIANKVYGTNNSGNVNDFLDLRAYTSEGTVDVTTWGQEYTNEQLREMFQTAKVDFVPAPYNDWEFVSLTENTDNWVGKYRRTGNISEVANLTYYLSNASSENANKFKSDYAYLTFLFSLTETETKERKIWGIVNPDLVVSASSTNSVSGKAVSNALAKKADKSELDSKLDSTAFGTFSFNDYEFGSDSANASLYLGPYGGADVDRLYLNKNRIGKAKLDIGAGRVDTVWKIGQENSEAPTLTAGSKSETLENIIDAPSKLGLISADIDDSTNTYYPNKEDKEAFNTARNAISGSESSVGSMGFAINEDNFHYGCHGLFCFKPEVTCNLNDIASIVCERYGTSQTLSVISRIANTKNNKKYISLLTNEIPYLYSEDMWGFDKVTFLNSASEEIEIINPATKQIMWYGCVTQWTKTPSSNITDYVWLNGDWYLPNETNKGAFYYVDIPSDVITQNLVDEPTCIKIDANYDSGTRQSYIDWSGHDDECLKANYTMGDSFLTLSLKKNKRDGQGLEQKPVFGAYSCIRFPDHPEIGNIVVGNGHNNVFGDTLRALFDYSFSSGKNNASLGKYSITCGTRNTAVYGGVALGSHNAVLGQSGFAVGETNFVGRNGSCGAALGSNNTVNSKSGIAAGRSNKIDGLYSVALGYENTINTDSGTALGRNNMIYGAGSFATGNHNLVFASTSGAIGSELKINTSSETGSYGNSGHLVSGNYNNVSGGRNLIVGGQSCKALLHDSIVIGNNLKETSKAFGKAIFGNYNAESGASIVLGSGSSEGTRKNAFEVYADGAVKTPNARAYRTDGADAKRLTTKEYVDNALDGKVNTELFYELGNHVDVSLESKLDKVSSLTYEAYVHVGNIQSTMPFTASMDNSAGGDCAVLLGRDSNGRAQVNEPVEDKDIANKKYVDTAISATDISEIAKDYTVLNSKNWSTTYANTGDIGEFGVPDYTSSKYPIIYNQPVNEEVIELAEIRNTDTNTTIATFTSKEELGTSNAATAYHFGDNYTLLVIHPQDGDYKTMMDGAIPYSSWTFNYCIGVYLTGAITNTPGELWMADSIPTTANLTISFPTPLVAPKGYKTLLDSSYLTRYKYTIYDDGKKECEILACAEDISINSSWGTLYEGSLGSYSFKSGFFTAAPEMSAEIINTKQIEESGSEGSVACLMETGFHPTATSTGVLYAVRPNNAIVSSSTTERRIYFKIHAKQV